MKKKDFLSMNLQFFAEPAPESPDENVIVPPKEKTSENDGGGISIEEQLQQLRVENAKLKKAQEDAATDAASWKKKYNATLSDAEKLSQEKAEREAQKDIELETLRKENAVSKLEKNFLTLGYPQDMASKAAEAQYDGDTDTLFKIQSQVQKSLLKKAEADWLKSRPEVVTGAGDEKTTVTREQFEKMGYSARVEFKRKYPETYKTYTK